MGVWVIGAVGRAPDLGWVLLHACVSVHVCPGPCLHACAQVCVRGPGLPMLPG